MPNKAEVIASRNQDIDSNPTVVFEASPMIPNRAKMTQKTKQQLANIEHLLIVAFRSSRFLKGCSSKKLAIISSSPFLIRNRLSLWNYRAITFSTSQKLVGWVKF